MSVLLLGLSHKTAPIEVRERFAVPDKSAPEWAGELAQRPGVSEAMVLSTCNRVEFLLKSDPDASGSGDVLKYLLSSRRIDVPGAEDYFYRYADREAVRHVFRVAASLDSMVVGEPQILGQVKEAYHAAKAAGAIRGELDLLINHAFRAARRVRNETGIGELAISVSYVAVELARKIFGELRDLTILLIGAGEMAELAARHLRAAGRNRLIVTNRTFERAQDLAAEFEAEPARFDRLLELLTSADVVISSTGSPEFIVSRKAAEGVIAARKNRPVFLVDIAVPRDIDPEINLIDNMFVYDIDDLQQVADANMRERQRESERAEAIIEEEIEKLMHRLKTHEVKPTIISLNEELDRMRRAEIERFRSKLGELTPQQEQAIEALTTGLMKKVAHHPITNMKKLANHPNGIEFVEFVRRAFNLKD